MFCPDCDFVLCRVFPTVALEGLEILLDSPNPLEQNVGDFGKKIKCTV